MDPTRGVHEPILVDGGPEVDGQRSLLGLVAKDNNMETLKEAVKAQEKIETDEWFEDDDAEEESSDDEGGKYSFPISSMLQMVLSGMHWPFQVSGSDQTWRVT